MYLPTFVDAAAEQVQSTVSQLKTNHLQALILTFNVLAEILIMGSIFAMFPNFTQTVTQRDNKTLGLLYTNIKDVFFILKQDCNTKRTFCL